MANMAVALVGSFQVGKSTTINCLLGERITAIGVGLPTTHSVTRFRHGSERSVRFSDRSGVTRTADLPPGAAVRDDEAATIEVSIPSSLLRHVDIVDSPGVAALQTRPSTSTTAHDLPSTDDLGSAQAVNSADLIIVVVPNRPLNSLAYYETLLPSLGDRPYIVIMNCLSGGNPDPASETNQMAAEALEADLAARGLHPLRMFGLHTVWPYNAAWDAAATLYHAPLTHFVGASAVVPNVDQRVSPEVQRRDVDRYFTARGEGSPSVGQLRQYAQLDVVRDFLDSQSLRFGCAPELGRIFRDIHTWRVGVQKSLNELAGFRPTGTSSLE